MRKLFHFLLVINLFIIFLAGCGTKENKSNIDKLQPAELVKTYYESLAKGDYETAKACLSEEYANQVIEQEDSDFKNLAQISNIRISNPAQIKLYGKNYDEVQVTVKYNAVYKKISSSNNGEQLRFIYVGKKQKYSPWKIISIGTGP